MKQFFRELPDPLLTFRLHDTFLRCFSVESEQVRHMSLLLTCHLLPSAHMSTLRFTMHFLQCVAAHSDSNKMDLQNLAVCMAPNLLYAPGKCDRAMATESRLLQQETGVIQLLMERADALGMVSDSLCQRTSLMMSCCFPSDDELERSEFEDGRVGKKKKRSGSFQGDVSSLSPFLPTLTPSPFYLFSPPLCLPPHSLFLPQALSFSFFQLVYIHSFVLGNTEPNQVILLRPPVFVCINYIKGCIS